MIVWVIYLPYALIAILTPAGPKIKGNNMEPYFKSYYRHFVAGMVMLVILLLIYIIIEVAK